MFLCNICTEIMTRVARVSIPWCDWLSIHGTTSARGGAKGADGHRGLTATYIKAKTPAAPMLHTLCYVQFSSIVLHLNNLQISIAIIIYIFSKRVALFITLSIYFIQSDGQYHKFKNIITKQPRGKHWKSSTLGR